MRENVREQLIKQFATEVIEATDKDGAEYYVCPVCKKPVGLGMTYCQGCRQRLSWENIHNKNKAKGLIKASVEFEVPSDFLLGDCRKCPLSYIGVSGDEKIYECPLRMRGDCQLKLSMGEAKEKKN